MNKSDEQIKSQWATVDNYNLEKALHHFRQYEGDVRNFLADCVATLCDVDVEKMLSKTDVIYLAHARWLYWYAYRYMTNESYEKISKSTVHNGCNFTSRAIQSGVNKIAMMIANEPLWRRRWAVIKRIIKLRDQQEEKIDNTITINVPKHLRDKINIQIKDK